MTVRERCSVLIVEDDPAITEFVASVLSDEGYRVEVAATGEEGLAALERARPSAILLDVLLPVMDGPTFLREIRQRYGTAVPVILMTAARDNAAPEQVPQTEGRLLKPFELDDLLAEVRRVLGEHECVP